MNSCCTIPQVSSRVTRSLLALAVASGCAAAWAGGTRLDSELSLERDSNPARAEAGEGVPGEFIQGATVRIARSQLIDERSGWVLHGQGSVHHHDRFHGLDELDAAVGGEYRIQPVVGYTAPWYEVGASLERSVRASSTIRNVTRAVASVSTGVNFTDRIFGSAGLRLTRAWADSGSVADQHERALDLEGNYRLWGAASAYLRGTLARGDQLFSSSATSDHGTNGIDAEALDPAFGPGFEAYRSRASTHVVEAGALVPAGPRQSWTLWGRAVHSASVTGAVYDTRQVGISWRLLMQ